MSQSQQQKKRLSAQVVFRAASGRRLEAQTAITAENVTEYAPSREAVDVVARWLRSKGFEVGPVVGNSASVTASPEVFERVFRVQLMSAPHGGLQAKRKGGGSRVDLPLDTIPAKIRDLLEAITFTEPPEFGPTRP